ncbi:hypothetical protein GGR56DRAFT_98333 [Xylariaceae sp. FL0804]|nr:hypothetical protein GGR56DRAFT_98333 [Xylariaceae sp. FL0804]
MASCRPITDGVGSVAPWPASHAAEEQHGGMTLGIHSGPCSTKHNWPAATGGPLPRETLGSTSKRNEHRGLQALAWGPRRATVHGQRFCACRSDEREQQQHHSHHPHHCPSALTSTSSRQFPPLLLQYVSPCEPARALICFYGSWGFRRNRLHITKRACSPSGNLSFPSPSPILLPVVRCPSSGVVVHVRCPQTTSHLTGGHEDSVKTTQAQQHTSAAVIGGGNDNNGTLDAIGNLAHTFTTLQRVSGQRPERLNQGTKQSRNSLE